MKEVTNYDLGMLGRFGVATTAVGIVLACSAPLVSRAVCSFVLVVAWAFGYPADMN